MRNKVIEHLRQRCAQPLQFLKDRLEDFRPYNLAGYAVNGLTPKQGYQLRENIAYGLKSRQRLDLYTTRKGVARALIVFVHGGAWTSGDKASYKFVGEAFARYGFDVAILNYHLAPEHIFPKYIDDLAVALNFLDNQQQQLGISTEKIALMGHSAGAFNIASLLYHPQNFPLKCQQQIKALIGIAGPYHFDYKGDPLAQFAFNQDIPYQQVMPYYFVQPNQVQHYLLLADNDQIVQDSNSTDFQQQLQQVGNHCQILRIAKTGHVSIIGSVSSLLSRFFPTRQTILTALDQVFPQA